MYKEIYHTVWATGTRSQTFVRDLDERRKLRHELGPAYRPLMGTPMGHFELDLAKPMHQLAAIKVMRKSGVVALSDIIMPQRAVSQMFRV